MLERMVLVKPALASILLEDETGLGVEFSKSEWDLLEKVVKALKPFDDATKLLSFAKASISDFIPVVTTIIRNLETGNEFGVKAFKKNLKGAMETRFCNAEDNEHLAVATYLDPRYKNCFFRNAETMPFVKEILIRRLNEINGSAPDQLASDATEEKNAKKSNNGVESFKETMKRLKMKSLTKPTQNSSNENIEFVLQNYLDEGCIEDDDDPLLYWKHKSNSPNPIEQNLSTLAVEYLTPQPTSVDVERLFSTAGDIFTNERNRLTPEHGEQILFCRENMPLLKFQY